MKLSFYVVPQAIERMTTELRNLGADFTVVKVRRLVTIHGVEGIYGALHDTDSNDLLKLRFQTQRTIAEMLVSTGNISISEIEPI